MKNTVIINNESDLTNNINSSNSALDNSSDIDKNIAPNKKEKQFYTFFQTYTSKNNPFNFKAFKLVDGILFFSVAIILPFLINIIVTYINYIAPSDTNQQYNLQRAGLILFSIVCSGVMLIYLWVRYGKKFVTNGGLIFFWMSIFMPISTWIFTMILQNTGFYNDQNKMVLDTISQMVAELISVLVILLTTKGLFKRILKTYKDGWVFYISVMIGIAVIFALNALVNLLPNTTNLHHHFFTSSNQDELNKLLSTTAGIIVLGIFTIIIAPFMEELTTRHGIFTLCGNKWLGLVAATIYFAGMHVADYGDWQSIINYLGPAIVLSFLFLISNGNVAYTITLHAILNIIAYISSIINLYNG